jgi:hypothetical protein
LGPILFNLHAVEIEAFKRFVEGFHTKQIFDFGVLRIDSY